MANLHPSDTETILCVVFLIVACIIGIWSHLKFTKKGDKNE